MFNWFKGKKDLTIYELRREIVELKEKVADVTELCKQRQQKIDDISDYERQMRGYQQDPSFPVGDSDA